jgi:hypothetical protein
MKRRWRNFFSAPGIRDKAEQGKKFLLPLLAAWARNVQGKELLLAFAMALTLWFGISGMENVESQVDVRLEYKGIPKDLVIRGPDLVNKVAVRVSGPAGQVRAMIGRDYVFTMDLSSLHPGENALPIAVARSGLFRGLKVIEVTPPEIRLTAETVLTREVPLKADIRGDLPNGLQAEALLIPEKVLLQGIPKEVNAVQEIVVPLALGRVSEPGSRDLRAPLALPAGMEARPASVDAVVRVDWKRQEARLSRTVHVQAPGQIPFSSRPSKVQIRLALPDALIPSAADNKDIRATVTLAKAVPGVHTLPVRIALPTGALLLEVTPEEVSVTVEREMPE